MGMKSVRMSRKNHSMPIMSEAKHRAAAVYSDGQIPETSVLRDRDAGVFPSKTAPNANKYPTTPPPKTNVSSLDGEGPIRGRQAKKSSSGSK